MSLSLNSRCRSSGAVIVGCHLSLVHRCTHTARLERMVTANTDNMSRIACVFRGSRRPRLVDHIAKAEPHSESGCCRSRYSTNAFSVAISRMSSTVRARVSSSSSVHTRYARQRARLIATLSRLRNELLRGASMPGYGIALRMRDKII